MPHTRMTTLFIFIFLILSPDPYFYCFLARLDEVQEELLYYPDVGVGVGVGIGVGVSKKFNVKVFLCDGQGAVRRVILSL